MNVSKTDSQLVQRIDLATTGLQPYLNRMLKELPACNSGAIADYILAMQTEINPTLRTRKNLLFSLMHFSRFLDNMPFRKIAKVDILKYLDSYRKSDEADPLHKWIGTYNIRRAGLIKFFRWLYSPDARPEERQTPPFMAGIKQLRRKETSVYKPTDLWTEEDDAIFVKYCPQKRISCYHMVARDTSARPQEILKLKIKDVIFKRVDDVQYAEVVVSGKTTQRSIPLFASIPYLKDWLNEHPFRDNPEAPLFSSTRKAFGGALTPNAIFSIYTYDLSQGRPDKRRGTTYGGYFKKLLLNPEVPPADKVKIEALLKKPWNPYLRRHSALTDKARILKEHVLRQHAGWGISSKMPQRYLHFFGAESSEDLLTAYGVLKKDKTVNEYLKPKVCPDCKEPNKIDAKFCSKCHLALTFGAFDEVKQKAKEKEDKLEAVYRALLEKGILTKE